ncbi:NADPH-dependent oxidoreductase [Candidatus Chloroploca sp. Khr17]|uniref:NADPH-dependent oxidoreductase n=1 Tax=Candidatus Chloroploca sp. Khr17 TaxID=2496869 RepID=UPI00101B62DE|nr:NADPH-dependent oxidoreductase [Candidatus Chloroploca sp. Khr17]
MGVSEATTARYGSGLALPAELWNETVDVLLGHCSVRAYSNEPVPEGALEVMIAAAQSASTGSNLQSWSVIAVTDPERKARLAELGGKQNFIARAPLFLVWLTDLGRVARAAEAREMPHQALDYLETFLMGSVDAAIAAQNAAIAAESLGLGMVYVGAMRNKPEEVAAELGLPPRTFAVFGMAVGYPDPERPAAVKPRLPLDAVLHREQYQADQDSQISAYSATMAAFYTEQQMKVEGDWVEHSARRVAGPESLAGRHRLREALQKLGFELI